MKLTMLALTSSLIILQSSGPLLAEQIYKSVDEKGRIIYSGRPPPGVVKTEEVAVEPGPRQEQVKEAQQRAEHVNQRAREMAQERTQKMETRRAGAGPSPMLEPVGSGTSTSRPPVYPGEPSSPGMGNRPGYAPDRPVVRPTTPAAGSGRRSGR